MVNLCLIKRKELQPFADATIFCVFFFLIGNYDTTFKGIDNNLLKKQENPKYDFL